MRRMPAGEPCLSPNPNLTRLGRLAPVQATVATTTTSPARTPPANPDRVLPRLPEGIPFGRLRERRPRPITVSTVWNANPRRRIPRLSSGRGDTPRVGRGERLYFMRCVCVCTSVTREEYTPPHPVQNTGGTAPLFVVGCFVCVVVLCCCCFVWNHIVI